MVSYASSMRAYLEQKEHLASLRDSIAQSNESIEVLEREQKRWGDPAYVEAQARQRFGWVMPGEVGYQVIGVDGKPLTKGHSLPEPAETTESGDPMWWQQAWGSVKAAGNPPEKRAPADLIRAPKQKRR